MDSQGRRWLGMNRANLVHPHLQVMHIVDYLVQRGVFAPDEDDYQIIESKNYSRLDQTNALLDFLHVKGDDAILQFQEVLQNWFPDVFHRCVNPGESIYSVK